jgi:hypothetical protein
MKLFRVSILAVIFSCFFVFATKGVLVEQQAWELKTPDGLMIVLNPDSTWAFKDGKASTIDKDFTVPVGGGRIILITQDGKWGFTHKEIINSTVHLISDSIVAKGHNINMDLTTATAAAQKQVLKELNLKIRAAIKNFKLNPAKLEECIKNVEKGVDKKEDFKKGGGWDVSITIIVNKIGLLGVTECAKKEETVKGAKKGGAAPSVKKEDAAAGEGEKEQTK